jgi:hypothetical protein
MYEVSSRATNPCRLLKNSAQAALCQGTTLVVPVSRVEEHGFSRCTRHAGAEARSKAELSARLKSCPDTKLAPFEFSGNL